MIYLKANEQCKHSMICPKTKIDCQNNCTGTGGYAGDDCHLKHIQMCKEHDRSAVIYWTVTISAITIGLVQIFLTACKN